MATVTITHSTVTGAAANLNVLVDGPKWDANHVVAGLENVDNTSDVNKPVSTAQATALALKAPLISPSFTTPNLGAATATSLTSSGTVAVSPTPASGLPGLVISQDQILGTYTGQDVNHNSISVTNDVANIATAGRYSHGVYVTLNVGAGPAAVGGRYAFKAVATLGGAGNATGGDVVGVSGIAASGQPNGGTNTGAGALGTLYGQECIGHATSGAINYLVVSGGEVDAIIDTGASAKHRWGWSIVGNGDVRGAVTDAALEIGAVTAAGAHSFGILLDSQHNFAPLQSTGTVLGTDGVAATIANGIDLSAYTITGNFLKGPNGFSVDGSGKVTTAGTIAANAGVTSTLSAQTGYQHDISAGATITITGSGAVLSANLTPETGGNYVVCEISEIAVTGGTASYALGAGQASMGAAVGCFVASTTTPAAGKASVQYSGTRYVLYSNITGAAQFKVHLRKLG